MRHNNHHQNNNNKNRNNTLAQNQSIVLLDIPYIVIRSVTRFKLAILTAASSWVTDFFMVSTSAWYCLVSEFVALTTLAIFSVVGKAYCNPTDRPTCSTAPFHLDFGTADCYVMGAPGHTWLPSLPNILPGSSGQTADRPSWKVEDLSFC